MTRSSKQHDPHTKEDRPEAVDHTSSPFREQIAYAYDIFNHAAQNRAFKVIMDANVLRSIHLLLPCFSGQYIRS